MLHFVPISLLPLKVLFVIFKSLNVKVIATMSEKTFTVKLSDYEEKIGKEGTFESVSALCDTFWAWRMANWPEFATFTGSKEFDAYLNDNSLEAFKNREVKALEFMHHCEVLIKREGLNEDDRFNALLLREELRNFTEGAKYQGYLLPVCYNEGMQVDFEQLTSWMTFQVLSDYENYISRLRALPNRISQDIALMQEGIRVGRVHHAVSMKGVLEECDKLQNVKHPEQTSLFKPLSSFPDSVDEENRTQLKETATQLIENEIIPAFMKMRIFIENDYIPNCRQSEGVNCLSGGEDFYKQCLRFHLSLDLTPQQVHDIGRREVYRIRQQMEEIVKKLGFQGEFRDFLQHLRTNQEFFYTSKGELLDSYRDICYNKIRPKLKQVFHKIPESDLIIEAVPESRPDAPAAYYLCGTLDGSRPGKFYVNCNKLDMCAKYEQMTLSLHEGEPGHHFQGMYAIEMKNVPKFRQHMEDMLYSQVPSRFPMYTAYVEGWGLYCEYLGNELGLYEDDLYSLFGHLSFEMHRACRLVADTGIHHLGWSYEKTRLLFLENTALAESFVNVEVRRYITWPGQACAYKIGQMRIQQLREKAANALGAEFDVRDFHDVCLKCLMCPLNVLEMLVEKYVHSKNPAASLKSPTTNKQIRLSVSKDKKEVDKTEQTEVDKSEEENMEQADN